LKTAQSGSKTSPDYTDRLTRIFAKHGTYGTWYGHSSVGRPHARLEEVN